MPASTSQYLLTAILSLSSNRKLIRLTGSYSLTPALLGVTPLILKVSLLVYTGVNNPRASALWSLKAEPIRRAHKGNFGLIYTFSLCLIILPILPIFINHLQVAEMRKEQVCSIPKIEFFLLENKSAEY